MEHKAAQGVCERTFRPGQYLFREGDPPASLYILKKGTVSVRKAKNSAYVEIGRIYANEVVGEVSFFDRLPRSASAIALTEVEAIEIQYDNLEKIYASVPTYMKTITAAMAERLRKADDMIRLLQKDIIRDPNEAVADLSALPENEITAADVLAATSDVGNDDDSNEKS